MIDESSKTPADGIDDPSSPGMAEDPTPLCPGCLRETKESWDFCPTCNAPLGATVGLDPIKRIYTMRYLIHRGVTRPNTPTIVIGLLLFYALNLAIFFTGPSNFESGIESTVFAVYATFFGAISIYSIYLIWRNIEDKDDSDE